MSQNLSDLATLNLAICGCKNTAFFNTDNLFPIKIFKELVSV